MEEPQHRACLLLGSNIRPEQNLPHAAARLREQLTVRAASRVWQSAAVGASGPDFLNGAMFVSTPLQAADLRSRVLRPLEAQMGRVRTQDKNAPRTIDVDIVVFDGLVVDPALWRYAHVAIPVAELLPDLLNEDGQSLMDVAFHLGRDTHIVARMDVSIDSAP